MASYYEYLQLLPSATPPEIEAAIDRLYDETRRKVTSFDPQVAAQANQGLQLLEQMRAILLTPERRAAYDAALGIGATPGGLLDPEALFRAPAPVAAPVMGMPSVPMAFGQAPGQPAAPAPSMTRTDAWICPTCQQANLIGAQFCVKDGTRIGHSCPQCGKMAELSNDFCPVCGAEKRKVYEAKKQAEVDAVQGEIRSIDTQIERIHRIAGRKSAGGLTGVDYETYRQLRQGGSAGCLGLIVGILAFYPVTSLAILLLGEYDPSFSIIIGIIVCFVLALVIMNSSKGRMARNKARELIAKLQQQLPSLQQKISEVQSHHYPD